MKFTNRHNLPEPIFRAITRDEYTKGDADYSVTQLLQPPRKIFLEAHHDHEITEDAIDGFWRTYGKLTHKILEQHGEASGALTEQRFSMMLMNRKVSGAIDRMEPHITHNACEGWLLEDYKITSAWSLLFEPRGKREWEQQLNLYAILAEHNGYPVNDLQVHVILRDWQRNEARKNNKYPQSPFITLKMTLWDVNDGLRFLADRLELFLRIENEIEAHTLDNGEYSDQILNINEFLPPCSDDERWAKPDTYAVMRDGRKSALRVLDSYSEARKWQAKNGGDVIVHRPGDSIRCKDYCNAAPFCAQRQKEMVMMSQAAE